MKKSYINFLKSISIILVICIHLLSRAWSNISVNSMQFKILTIIDSICLICVPIFLMCSGTIFLNRNDSIKKIIFKYMLKIYLIAVLFGFLYRFADHIIYQHGSLDFNILYNIIKQSVFLVNIYHLWYLKVVLAMYITIPIFRYILKLKIKYIEHIILALLFIICMILPIFIQNSTFLSIIGIFGYLIYFYLGYYLDKYNNKKIVILLILLGIISYIYTVYNTIDVSTSSNVASVEYMQYLSINIMFISCFIYSLVRFIQNIFNKKRISKLLEFTTKCNFYIYLIHGFVIGLLSYLNIINIYNYSNIFMLFVNLILVYFICLIISYLMYIVINKLKSIKN